MAIKIVPSGEAITSSTITACILGNPSTGKTTLANTSEKPLLLAFDMKGARRSLRRPDTVLIQKWSDIADLEESDFKGYKTVIIDTIGHMIDVLSEDIMRNDPKMNNNGQLSLRGFGKLKANFRAWTQKLYRYGISIVMVAHGKEEMHGDDVRIRIDAQGASREEVYKEADLMGRLSIRGGKRYIDWDPSESGFGKNPAGLPAENVPNIDRDPKYLQKCIRTTTDFLNRASEEATIEEQRLTELRKHFQEKIDTPQKCQDLVRKMKEVEAPFSDRSVLVSVAAEKGWHIDKKTLTVTDPEAAEEEQQTKEETTERTQYWDGKTGQFRYSDTDEVVND